MGLWKGEQPGVVPAKCCVPCGQISGSVRRSAEGLFVLKDLKEFSLKGREL